MMRKYLLFVLLFVVLFVNVIDVSAGKNRKGRHAKYVPTCETVAVTQEPDFSSYWLDEWANENWPDEITTDFVSALEQRYIMDYLMDYRLWHEQNNLCNNLYQPQPFPYTYLWDVAIPAE